MLDNRNSPGTVGGAARQVAGRGGSWAVAVSRSDLSSCPMVSPDLASSSYVNISAHSSLPPERWTPWSQEIIGEVSGSLLQLLRSIHNMGGYPGPAPVLTTGGSVPVVRGQHRGHPEISGYIWRGYLRSQDIWWKTGYLWDAVQCSGGQHSGDWSDGI